MDENRGAPRRPRRRLVIVVSAVAAVALAIAGWIFTRSPDPGPPLAAADLPWRPVQLPPWPQELAPDSPPCPRDEISPAGERATGPGWAIVRIVASTSADLDHDDRPDVVAVLACEGAVAANPAVELQQVVAFAQAGRGAVTVLGQVMATSADTGSVASVLPAPDASGVRVLVRDNPLAGTATRQQDRTFAFDGQAFRQTGGPTEFGPNPDLPDVAVSASPVVLAPAGELRIELRNLGLAPARRVDLDIYDETGTLALAGAGCARLGTPEARGAPFQRTGAGASFWCQSGPLAPGETAVITLAVSAPATGAGQRLYVSLLADRGGQPDADPTNHEVEVPVRVG